MKKMVKWPKNTTIKIILNKNIFCTHNRFQLFLVYIIVKLLTQIYQNTLTLNHYIIQHVRNLFLKLDNAILLLPKKNLFSPILDTKPFFAIKKKIK